MELMDVIRRRRAVREYAAKPVGKDMLLRLIDAAVWAPSAMNRQPWLFTIVQDQKLLDHVSRESKTYMLAKEADHMPAHLKEMLNNPSLHIFYHAPALILISANSAEPWAAEDCALAAENLMLAACDAGLGSCWIGFAQKWLQTPEGKKALDLPMDCLPVAPIIVGSPAGETPPVTRKPPEILAWR
jgi:nitroreductase